VTKETVKVPVTARNNKYLILNKEEILKTHDSVVILLILLVPYYLTYITYR
jgi:hypothetical protein